MADPKQPIDPQKEIEIQVNELEERVDRLRAIYEQYFMGYEKLEPTVPRKDVDRRFVVLRKANIRNTALRFRFNVVTQKFNTYAMYWTRICRQIEEGTFKRHVQRANKRFGNTRRGAADDFSIDVELGDFEVDFENDDLDTAAVLAEAEAAAAEAPTNPPAARPGGFGVIDSIPPASAVPASGGTPPPQTAPSRVARGAVLPASAKGRVLVKKGAGLPGQSGQPQAGAEESRPRMPSITDEAPASLRAPPVAARMPSITDEAPRAHVPPSGASGGPQIRPRMPSVSDEPPRAHVPPSGASGGPQVRPRMPSVSDEPPPSVRGRVPSGGPQVRPRMPSVSDADGPVAMRPPMGSVPDPPSTSVIRAATPHVYRPPPGVVRPGISPSAQSVRRIQAAVPAAPPSDGAPPVRPSERMSAAPPADARPSVARTPAAAPSAPAAARPAPASSRMPVGLPSSTPRIPAAPAAATEPPKPVPTAPPLPASERRLPMPPPSRGPMPAAAPVRPPSASSPDLEGAPRPHRPPPALPSQIKKG